MKFRVHNGNANETVEAENRIEALNRFVEIHPEEFHNAAFIEPLTQEPIEKFRED